MSLKGTLKDFSVADIFQLIGQQGKSGSLYVRTREKEAQIVFDSGKVVLGTFKKSDEDFLLGTMLLRAGVITSDQLAKAIETQKATLRSLGDILKSSGAINSATLGEFVNLQLKEVLFRLFQWNDGLYEFVAEKINYNKTIIKPQTAEAVLMDGFRMLDEWPAITEKVGALEGVYASRVSPTDLIVTEEEDSLDLDSAFSDSDEDREGSDEKKPKKENAGGFTEEEKKVITALDGKRPLQEVIYVTRLGTFDTLKCIHSLLNRSAVEKVSELLPTRVDFSQQMIGKRSISAWILGSYRFILMVFILSLALPVIAYGVRSYWSEGYSHSTVSKISFGQLKEISEREVLVQLLDLYRLQSGEYPNLLEELQRPALAAQWDYSRNGDFYVLKRRVANP
jgi:hypothetical protein